LPGIPVDIPQLSAYTPGHRFSFSIADKSRLLIAPTPAAKLQPFSQTVSR
jgi:hypothetical protein